jgi:polyhydroxyalkanoate synthesis regulator phasin
MNSHDISRSNSKELQDDILDLSSLKDGELDSKIQQDIQHLGFLDSQVIVRKNNHEWTQLSGNNSIKEKLKNSTAQSGIREMIQQMQE